MRRTDFEHIIAAAADASGETALCLEPHDLVLAKCVAGRERDWDFAREALAHELVDADALVRRVDDLPVAEADRRRIGERLDGIRRQLVTRDGGDVAFR